MQLEAKKYLYDIQQAVEPLTEFTGGKVFEDYEQNTMLRAAVERQFEIIGEALAHARQARSDARRADQRIQPDQFAV